MATTTTSEPSATTRRGTGKRTTTRKTAAASNGSAANRSSGYSQGAIIGVAAAGMLAGLAAAVGRKAVVQATKRAFLLMQLKHALAKHAFQEENVIYPALRDHNERDEADHLNHDHGYVKQFLYDLDNMPRNSSAWIAKVREFRKALETHIREEEDSIFPKLRARLGKDANSQLTTAMNKEGFKLA